MRIIILILLGCLAMQAPKSQPALIDSLNTVLNKTSNDTLRLVLFSRLGDAQVEVNIDSAYFYAQQYLRLSQKLRYELNEADALQQVAEYLTELASLGNALELSFKALQLAEDSKEEKKMLSPEYLDKLRVSNPRYSYSQYRQYIIGKINNMIGAIYSRDIKAIPYFRKAREIANSLHADDLLISAYEGLAMFTTPDSALILLKKSYQLAVQTGNKKHIPQITGFMIMKYHEMGDHISELSYLRSILEFCIKEERIIRIGYGYLVLAEYFYTETKAKDSALIYAVKALQVAREVHSPYLEYYASDGLAQLYKADNKKDSALKYLELKIALREKTSGEEKIRQLQNADFLHQQQEAAIETSKKQFRSEMRIYGLLAGLFALLFLTIILWRNNKQRQKSFALLQSQKEQTEKALQDLQSTQTQLIQKEKMASLGELTAGIAHEIQNPLNFVNNFSDVNAELISELQTERCKEARDFENEDALLNDIKENEQKINLHGKRADAIVKGMLQHSRTNTGQKESTDINALVDEYLRLAYHGLRAKDKSFNVKLNTDFDPAVGKINVIPQDIGRLLLNLVNNAFYAVAEKLKSNSLSYEPTVSVATRKFPDRIEITVADNGNGISKNIIDKIFQPFFTTKPTGQGTGLGLSLSYDIVKAHGGLIKVETEEKEGSAFTIELSTK